MRPPTRPTLFPYTTLFRSVTVRSALGHQIRADVAVRARLVLDDHRLAPGFVQLRRDLSGQDVGSAARRVGHDEAEDRKSTRLNSSHRCISYAVFCLKKKKQ